MHSWRGTRRPRFLSAVFAIAAFVALALAVGFAKANTSAQSGYQNTGPTTVSGNLGLSPGSAVTGFPPGLVSGGVQNVANAAAVQAQSDLVTAYNDAAGVTAAFNLNVLARANRELGANFDLNALPIHGAAPECWRCHHDQHRQR